MKQDAALFRVLKSAFIFVLIGPLLYGQAAPPPDLDLAYKSAAQFWNLVSQKKRLEASRLLATEEQRSAFLGWVESPYLEPSIKSLRFGSERDRLVVAVSVKTPVGGAMMTRNLEQEWIYQGKRWVLNLDITETKLFSSKPLPTDNDKLLEQFRAGFRFKTTEIEIPDDAFGKSIEGSIEYTYDGSADLVLDYVSGPEFINVELGDLKRLGREGKIRFIVAGRQLFSNENIPPLRLKVQSGLAKAEFTIPVRWNGHAPYRWTFTPPTIEPDYVGDVKLEVFNQSDEVWMAGLAVVTASSWELTGWEPQGDIRRGESVVYSFKVARAEQPVRQNSISLFLRGAQPTLTISAPYPRIENNAVQPAAPSRESLERLLQGAPAGFPPQ